MQNIKVVEKMENLIKKNLCYSDFKRYQNEFSKEIDFNIYQYGNLDIYYYDLFVFFKNAGVTDKFIIEYEKQLKNIDGVSDKILDTTENAYKNLVRKAVKRLNKKLSVGMISKDDFIE